MLTQYKHFATDEEWMPGPDEPPIEIFKLGDDGKQVIRKIIIYFYYYIFPMYCWKYVKNMVNTSVPQATKTTVLPWYSHKNGYFYGNQGLILTSTKLTYTDLFCSTSTWVHGK